MSVKAIRRSAIPGITYEEVLVVVPSDLASSGAGGNGATAVQITAANSTGATIAANKAVNLYNNSGVLSIRLADSSATTNNNYSVSGFSVAAIPTGTNGPVQLDGILSGFSGLTSGLYYSDPTTGAAGGITATVPSGADQYFQKVGFAISSSQLFIKIRDEIKLAGTATAPTPASPSAIAAVSNSAARTGSAAQALNSTGVSIAARQLVNLYNSVGGLTARLADTSAGGPGYIGNAITVAAIANGVTGLVQFDGILAGWSGLTSGQYYSDPATAGGLTATIPSVSGQHLQKIGFAISSAELYIKIGEAIKLS